MQKKAIYNCILQVISKLRSSKKGWNATDINVGSKNKSKVYIFEEKMLIFTKILRKSVITTGKYQKLLEKSDFYFEYLIEFESSLTRCACK